MGTITCSPRPWSRRPVRVSQVAEKSRARLVGRSVLGRRLRGSACAKRARTYGALANRRVAVLRWSVGAREPRTSLGLLLRKLVIDGSVSPRALLASFDAPAVCSLTDSTAELAVSLAFSRTPDMVESSRESASGPVQLSRSRALRDRRGSSRSRLRERGARLTHESGERSASCAGSGEGARDRARTEKCRGARSNRKRRRVRHPATSDAG